MIARNLDFLYPFRRIHDMSGSTKQYRAGHCGHIHTLCLVNVNANTMMKQERSSKYTRISHLEPLHCRKGRWDTTRCGMVCSIRVAVS